MERTTNFNAGPAALPLDVLQKHRKNLSTSMTPACPSWSCPTGAKNMMRCIKSKSLLKELMDIPDDYDILFLQGGASLQFSMLPMNF